MCMLPDVWYGDSKILEQYGDTWHRMSLLRPGVIKQHKPNYDASLQVVS